MVVWISLHPEAWWELVLWFIAVVLNLWVATPWESLTFSLGSPKTSGGGDTDYAVMTHNSSKITVME